jgi:hypothetical protein
LQRWVDFVMQLPQAHHEQQEHGVGENHPQQEQPQESRASNSQNNQQQQQQLPLHMLLLPVPPPPGAVAALSHPWPPQLLPGCSSQGLQGRGQGLGAGQLHKPWVVPQLLRMALTKQEPSLVLRGGAGSAQAVAALLVSDMPCVPFRTLVVACVLLQFICHSLFVNGGFCRQAHNALPVSWLGCFTPLNAQCKPKSNFPRCFCLMCM